MNRTIFGLSAAVAALAPLVFDSALKGGVLLAVAALCALALWRASAATRHLVWLVAVVALLVLPVLSAALPQWRVLPDWRKTLRSADAAPVVRIGNASSATAAINELAATPRTDSPAPAAPAITLPLRAPAGAAVSPGAPDEHAPTFRDWLPLAWATGCALLVMRLIAAHLLLRRAARSCVGLDDARGAAITPAFAAARAQLGIRQRVTLLLDQRRTIPVVWGVFRPRLMLPIEARGWTDDQLRSVLLHELAHIKRRDTLVQWLTQIACALHWWNPLVWLAAWRLHAERERACDDLVLASGVRPSAYAEHLLHVATKLSPARWTAACGLAMARKSSLEGRLLAVLSEKLNRRSVTSALAAAALILGAVVAIPIAMLRAADDKWNPHQVAHIGTNDFSAYCVHDGKDAAFVIAYHGDFGSATEGSSNAKTRTWIDSGTLTAKKPSIALGFHRTQDAPGKLSITTAPAEAQDLSKPAPPPRDFGQKEYDLAKGRVFLLTDNGTVRQLDIATPVVSDHESAKKLAALIAAIPPQEREDILMKPKQKDARSLYEIWQRHARLSGDIPGALIGELAAAVKVFIGYNPTWETVPKLNEMLPRLDATHDWKAADAIALLDEVAAVKDSPLSMAMRRGTSHTIRNGEKLPEKFADAAWSGGKATGLRVAWVLEPGAVEHRIGAALKARLLVWNPGAVPVMLQVPTWYQGGVKATDAKGAEVEVSGISWTTVAQLVPCRLGPGEYIEIYTPGIGFGPRAGVGPWAGPRVGSNVLAKPGDDITLTHSPVPLDGSEVGMSEDDPHVIGPGWWQAHIKTRLARELPLPADAAERTRLLDRAVRELFSAAPTAEETAAFVADTTPDALDALIKRLAAREDVVSFSGKLPTAPAKFRVLAADPAADKTPRVVLGPGEYPLSGGTATSGAVTLKIVGRPVGDRRTNEAGLLFVDTEATGRVPLDPHRLNVPDGWGTWAIVCRPGEGFFYLLHKGTVRKIDYSAPRKVTDTPANDLPAEFRDEVKRQLDIAGVPDAQQAEIFEKPAPPAKTPEPKTGAVSPEPKNEYALAHFRHLQKYARENGDIPGGLIALLDRSLGVGLVTTLDALVKRLDATRDWTAKETAEFLDAAAATKDWTGDDGRLLALENYDIAQHGKPLPPELASLPWGKADDGLHPALEATGLRAAFTLEPAAASYAQGSQLPVTVHYHNSGTAPLVFPVGFRSMDLAEALDGQGRDILTALAFPNGDNGQMKDGPSKPKYSVRLEPGHWISVQGARLTIAAGRHTDTPDSHGIVMMAPTDATVKLKWSPMTATSNEGPGKKPIEWKVRVATCIERVSPMPKSRADRESLIRRVTLNLTGEEATAAEVAAFIADDAPDALARLTARFQALPPLARYAGWLRTGEQTFKVTSAPANYRGTVMTANGSGLYEVTDSVFLQHYGKHANLVFMPPAPVRHPHTIHVKDKEDRRVPHGIVWRHGSGVVWVAEKTRVRKFDFTTPGKLTETELPAGIASIPGELRAELVKAFPAVETAAAPAKAEAPLQPKHEYAQKLFRKWQASARTDGKIPGALIGHVAREVDRFIKQSPDSEESKKLAALRPRLDASRDWAQAEAVALLDDITAISTAPVSWADIPMQFDKARAVQGGEALPIELKSAAWGQPMANGLRAAWLLEPRGEQYALGSVLKARVLFHNVGKAPVVFKTETWHQHDGHTARDAKGAEIPVKATWFTGITPMTTFRLGPGEYCEVSGHGIAIGAGEYKEEHSTGSVGAVIEAKEGDAVTLSHSVDAEVEAGWTKPGDPKDPLEFWKKTIAERIANEAPMPASAADRAQLIRRVTLDIFGVVPTAEEIAAFTADDAPDALAKLTSRLQAQPRVEPFSGKLPTGETKFRVIAADPDAARAPRTANAPGRYILGDGVHLLVSQLTEGYKPRTNKAVIAFLSPDPKVASPHKPYQIALPDGIGTYGIVWDRGSGALWVMQKGMVRKYEFANPSQVQEMKIEPGNILNIPAHLQEPMKKAFDVPGAPGQLPKLPDDAYARLGFHFQKFREEDAKRPGGERMGAVLEPSKPEDRDKEPLVLGVRTASDAQWRIGGTAKVGLVVRNRSDSDVKFSYTGRLDNGISVVAVDEAGKEHVAAIAIFDTLLTFQQMLLPAAHMAPLKPFTLRFDEEKRDVSEQNVAAFHLPPGKYTLRCKWNDARPDVAHEGEWTGELVNEEFEFTLAAAVADPPAFEAPVEEPAAEEKPAPAKPAPAKPAADDPFAQPAEEKPAPAKPASAKPAADDPFGEPAFETPAAPAATPDSKTGANAPAKPSEAGTRKLPKLPDDAYAKPGVHCQSFPAEDAKRPGGELMGGVLEPSKPADRAKEPLVLGVRTASDAQWRIGGTAKVGLVVRNRTGSDVKFSYTFRLDNRLSVVVVDEAGKEHPAAVAHFDGLLTYQQMLLPAGHVATIAEFTLRFDPEKRVVSEPHVSAFHLPPGKYKLRCKWNDARPDVAHEGEWTGELVNEAFKFTLAAAAPPPAAETPLPANGNIVSAEPGGVCIVTSASYKTDSYPLAEGLSIVVRSKLYHGPNTSTDVVAHWAATENRAAAHAVFQVASDTMGNRQPWAVLWENGAPALWFATGKFHNTIGEPAGKTQPLAQLVRIDLSDPENLVGHEFSGIPEAGGPSAAVLEKLLARMTWDGTGTETTRTLRWAQPTAKAGKTAGILFVFTRDAGKFQVSNGKPCDLEGLRGSIAEVGKEYANPPHQFTLVGPPAHWERMQQAAKRLRGWWPIIAGAAEETPATTPPAGSTDPKPGAKLQPATEQKLKWGEPVNGLRMALAWPPVLGEPGMGDAPEFYIVVQNVSEKAVQLTANDAAPNPRMLNLFDATLVSRTVDDVTIPGDWLLQPREAAFLRLFHSEQKLDDGSTISVIKENVVRTLGQYSYTAEMTIGKAPEGAWTGKLVTGATRGSADVLESGKPIALRSAPPMSWGVPKDGLRGAWRIIGEMRTGGQAKAELWVWNASTDVVKLSWTERADIGLAVMMSDGTNPAREAPVTRDKKDFQLHYLVLPAGQAVKLKEFAVRLGSAPDNAPAGTVSLPLTPGDWTLQAKWSDTRHIIDAAPEWHGVLDTGELKLKVTPEGATVAEPAAVKAKWPPVRRKTEWSEEFLAHSKAVAEARGTPDAKPDDLIAWGAEENGLRAGLLMAPRVTLGGQLPTRMVLRNVTNDVRELGLSLSLNRLTASAQTPDGKLLQVHKIVLMGNDALYKVTLTPGEQVEFEGPPVQFGVEHDGETKKVKMPKYPICGVETGTGKVHVHFKVEAKTGEAVVEVVAAKAGEDAGKPDAKAAGGKKIDWSKFPHYSPPEIPFANPFVPADALRLAAAPDKSKKDIGQLIDMIHQAAVEKAVELRPLLKDEKLKASDDEDGRIGFALAAYDYSVNGTRASLQKLLDAMATDSNRRAETAAWSLVYVDEWDLTLEAWLKHFGRFSNAEEHDLFWNVREFLYPENYAKFVAKRLADAKLDAASLRGVWKGNKDGLSAEIRFGDKTEWEVREGDKVSKNVLKTHTDFTGPRVHLSPPRESNDWIIYGFFDAGDAGTLRLHLTQNSSGEAQGIDLVLTKQANESVNPEQPKGKTAAKLDPGTEAQLDWGDAVNGLRAAVVVRSPQPGAAPGIFLAVQNVSAAALRFSDSMAAKEQRKLYLSDSAGILMALTSGEPTKTDAMLPPRGVLFLPMFPANLEKEGEAALIEGIRKDSLQTWRAVLNIENAPEGAWKGKLTTAETRGAVSADGPQPKNEAARALFKFWQRSARLNGDIPGGLLARLHDKVKEFIRNNTGDASGDPYAKKMAPLEPRFGPAGDWKPADVVALLDDIAAVTTIPLETTVNHLTQHTLRHGQQLPAVLEKADWGQPLAGGLRMAFLLEPRAAEYHLGTEVKARILLHNSGKEAVAFITSSFHQIGHKAKLADGSELKLDGTRWLTRSVPQAWRLAPGEYIELNTPGLAIGAHDKDRAEWSDVRAGSWILCKVGDEVTFLPGAVMLTSKETPIDPDWWLKFITERLEREAPVPLDTTEREHLLYRVVRDLFGTAPSTTEGDAFAADKSPDALKNLAVLLTKHQYGTRCEGPISAGETKFRVLPPDPDAAKKPRVAMNPGRYTLGGSTTLVVTRRPDGRRIVNEAHLSYNSPPGDGIPAPHHKIELPDGYDTWAVACVRGEKVLWLSQKGRLLKIDFTNFGKIQEARYEGDKTATAPIPADIREALRAALTVPDAPKQIHEPQPPAATPASPAASAPATEAPKTEKPKDGAAPDAAKRIPPATEQKLKWGEAVNGLRAALIMHPIPDEPAAEDKNDIFLVVQNVTRTEVWLHASDAAPNPRQLIWREKGILETINEVAKPIPADFRLQPGEVAFFRMTHPPAKPDGRNGGSAIAASIHRDPTFDLTGKMEIEKAPAGAWTGTLLSGEIKGGTAIPVLPAVEELKDTKPANAKLADDHYAKSGVPLAEQAWPMPPWGAEKDGLSAGLRIIGDARIGGEVKAELWVRNSSAKDVKFSQCLRADVGLNVVAKDKDGKEHSADITQFRGRPAFHQRLLPSGHIVKVKEFNVKFGAGKNDKLKPGWVNLQLTPGDYKLRAVWSDTTSRGAAEGEWTGKLTTGEVDLKIAATEAGAEVAPAAKPAAQLAKLPNDAYAKSGVPIGEFNGGVVNWSAEQNGLCLAMSLEEDAQWKIGGETKVTLWVCNPGEKDVKFQHCARRDIGLRVLMKGADGKELAADITQFLGKPSALPVLLPAGHIFKAKEFSVVFLPPGGKAAGAEPHFTLAAGGYIFRCELKLPGLTGAGADGKQRTPAEGEWTGTLKSGEVDVKLVAAADAPAAKPAQAKPANEHATVDIAEDGAISLDRKKVTLDELKAQAAMDAKKWFTIRADKDVPYAKVVEVMNALRKAGVVRISLKDGQAGDGKVRVASSTGRYIIDDQRTFSICKLASGPGYFTVHWRAKEGDPVSQWVRIHPVEPEGVRGTWAVAWEPGTDVLWWMDNADIGRMNFSDPKQVIVERSARVGARPPGFVPPDGVSELFESLGFFKGLWNRGTVGGDGNLSKRVMEATPAKASGGGKAQPEDAVDDVEDSHPAPPESPRADVKPVSKMLFNEDYAAKAVQSEKDVNFVLFYQGNLSSGISEWSSGAKWRFNGTVYLVDAAKTAIAGKNVNKRAIPVKYTSDAPTKLYLDGKEFDLSPTRGRIFILRDEGEPIQTARTLPLRDAKDLAAIGEFAAQWLKDAAAKAADDSYPPVGVVVADIPVGNIEWCELQNGLCVGLLVPEDREWPIGGEVKVELWVCNPGETDVKFHHNGRNDIGLRVFMKGADGKEHAAEIAQFRGYPVFTKHLLKAGHAFKAKAFTVQLGKPQNITANPWFELPAGDYKFRCEVKIPGSTVSTAGKQIIPAEGEWSGTIKSSEVAVKLAAANAGADAGKPAAKPPGANMVKVPDDQYVKSGFPADELVGEGVMWNDVGDGLLLGYRITGDEWRILGKDVKVELWVQNPGDKDVKFQLNMRPDIGVRMKMKGEKGEEHESNIVPSSSPPFGEHRLLPPGHALKVKEFTVSLLWPENDVSGIKGHYFAIDPGAYNFHCELELPGFSATGEGGKQLTPAVGEWTGKLTTRSLNVMVIAPDAPAPKPRIEHVRVRISKDGEVSLDRTKMSLDELKTRAARNAKKWFTIRADKDVPYAKVVEVVEALKAVGVTEFSFAEARVGDGKYRVANRTGMYEFDGKRRFFICQPFERKQWFTVAWPEKDGQPAKSLRMFPNVSEQTRGTWAVVWEPGTDVLWWVDDSDIGKMTLTDPARVIVDREGRKNNFSRDFALPDGVVTEFRRLGFEVGRKQVEGERPVIGGNTGGQEILSAEPVDAKGIPNKEGAAAPKPDAQQGGPRADVKPEQARQSNDKYSAVAYQTEKDVNFVLVHEGAISTGLSESWSETSRRWSIEGNIHLVDREKTKAASRNVDKRVIALKYTSDAPTKLFLDGKAYELATPTLASSKGALEMPGRIFILRDEGEPFQTDRTLALRSVKDLVTIGDFAMHDLFMAETYADNRRVQKLEGWALAWDTQNPIQHSDGEYVAQMRIFPDGRVLALSNGRELKEFKITQADFAELTRWLVEEGKVGEWKPEKVKIANTGQELEMSPVKNVWDRETDVLIFTRDGKRHGIAVEHGGPGPVFDVIRERLWELAKSGAVAKAADVAPKKGGLIVRARGEWSAEWQALSKVVAESRGLTESKAEDLVAWGAEGDGLRSGMLIPKRAKLGDTVKPLLVLRNVSGATKEMKVCTSLNVLTPSVRTADGKTAVEVLKISLRGADALFPVTLEAGEQLEFAGPPVLFGVGPGADGKPKFPDWPVAGVVTGAGTVLLKFNLLNVRGPETGEVAIQVAAAGAVIRGKVLKPDGTPAAGVPVRVDDGIERWKFRGNGFPELPKAVTTAADGTFSIEVPKHSVATNYEAFASSDEFAPLNAKVPEGGDVGVMQFAKGSLVTGRVFGLDGAGLAKVGIWSMQLEWRGRGPAPAKVTSTGADGTFSIPSIASGKYLLRIITRDLGAKELAVAFANPVIEAKDDAPVAVEIRPLPTVDLVLDARVLRGNVEFRDFEVRVSGTLPGHKAGDPGAFWTRQETTKLAEGKHTIAVPAGLKNATVRADRIYMRKGDDPVFIWRREGVEKREVGNTFDLGVADKPQTIGLTAQDAAMLDIYITSPDGKKLTNVKLTGSAECEAWGKLALDEWSQLNFPDHSKGEARFPACERVTFTITADGCEPLTQELGMIKPGEKKEVRVVMKTAAATGGGSR